MIILLDASDILVFRAIHLSRLSLPELGDIVEHVTDVLDDVWYAFATTIVAFVISHCVWVCIVQSI